MPSTVTTKPNVSFLAVICRAHSARGWILRCIVADELEFWQRPPVGYASVLLTDYDQWDSRAAPQLTSIKMPHEWLRRKRRLNTEIGIADPPSSGTRLDRCPSHFFDRFRSCPSKSERSLSSLKTARLPDIPRRHTGAKTKRARTVTHRMTFRQKEAYQ
jgi:hypothetical protein